MVDRVFKSMIYLSSATTQCSPPESIAHPVYKQEPHLFYQSGRHMEEHKMIAIL